jgi:rubrerythrin
MQDFTLKKALELAVTTEKDGAAFYLFLAAKYEDDTELKDIFVQLSKDEKAHEEQFTSILESLPDTAEPEKNSGQMYLLRATSSIEFLKLDLVKEGNTLTPQDTLVHALNFEKSTLLHYQSLKDIMTDSPQLDQIIAAEKEHISTLMKVIITNAKFRGLEDKW